MVPTLKLKTCRLTRRGTAARNPSGRPGGAGMIGAAGAVGAVGVAGTTGATGGHKRLVPTCTLGAGCSETTSFLTVVCVEGVLRT